MVKLNENTSYKRGQELLDAGQYEEAVEKFAEVINENPRAWKALNSQGFAYQKMSKYTDAVECFDKALAINPKSVEVLNNKGVTLSMRGLYKEAIECFSTIEAELIVSLKQGGIFSNNCCFANFGDMTSLTLGEFLDVTGQPDY